MIGPIYHNPFAYVVGEIDVMYYLIHVLLYNICPDSHSKSSYVSVIEPIVMSHRAMKCLSPREVAKPPSALFGPQGFLCLLKCVGGPRKEATSAASYKQRAKYAALCRLTLSLATCCFSSMIDLNVTQSVAHISAFVDEIVHTVWLTVPALSLIRPFQSHMTTGGYGGTLSGCTH